jgi:SAM-dependent methyltransferase
MVTNTVRVDPSNEQQLRAWDGDEGSYWAANADYYDRCVALHHERLLAAADIGSQDLALDVGCGTGQLSRDAARAASAGSVLGVDLSSAMLEVAKARATQEHLANVRFEQLDAQIHPFESGAFDVVVSRTGAMFFGNLVAAFTNLSDALRPGGRLALLTWQPLSENEWIRELSSALAAGREMPPPPSEAPGPFALSDPDRVRTVLGDAGLTDIELLASRADMWFGTDADDAHRFVLGQLGWMLQGLDDDGRARALEALRATVSRHQTDAGVTYDSAAWIITATRR